MQVQQILIPKVTIHKASKGKTFVYMIFIPRRFNDFIKKDSYKIIVLYRGREIEVGLRKVFRGNGGYSLTLPKKMDYIWEDIINKKEKISIILERQQ